jgi:hypothetical protein
MSDIWNKVQKLEGKTLYTSARNKPFDVVEVRPDRIVFTPRNGSGAYRWADRRQIETAYQLAGSNNNYITAIIVQEKYPNDRNSSYIAAIVNIILSL